VVWGGLLGFLPDLSSRTLRLSDSLGSLVFCLSVCLSAPPPSLSVTVSLSLSLSLPLCLSFSLSLAVSLSLSVSLEEDPQNPGLYNYKEFKEFKVFKNRST
jgi:hypothetical protein